MTKLIVNILFFLGISTAVSAQCAQWSVAPNYKSLSRFATELYKATVDDKVGIITAEGTVVYDAVADSITNLSEGYAVALKKEKKRMRMLAVIDETGKSIDIKDELYADAKSCFAGGQMLVKNKRNKFGFIDTEGKLAVACQLSKMPELPTSAELAQKDLQSAQAEGPFPFAHKKEYGYKQGENVILPPQFVSAQAFYGNYAIARTSTGYGILKLVAQPFVCKMTKMEFVDGMENTEFTSSLPANKDAAMKMICIDSTGMKFEDEGTKSADKAVFNLSTFRERRTFTVVATDDKGQLVLWNSVFSGNNDSKNAGADSKKTKKSKKKTTTKSKKKK